jgi:translocation and assembly module TamB
MPEAFLPRPSPPRRRRHALARLAALFVVLLIVFGWLAGTASGFGVLCSGLTRLTGGRLQIEAPAGRLLGDWQAQSLRWQDASREVELRQLAITWSPRALLHGELSVERIDAASLRVFFAPDPEPVKPPASLSIPLPLRIGHLALGRALLGKADDNPLTLAENIDATLSSDGRLHRLEALQAKLGRLALTADATLAGEPPFNVKAQAVLQGSALDRPFVLTLSSRGPLDALPLDGALAGAAEGKRAAASGELHALLTPFAERPIASLQLSLTALDPALLADGLPRALLDVDAQLDPRPAAAGESTISGRLQVRNRLSGTFDRQRLPIETLHTRLRWQGERLSFSGLTLALSGGGRLSGQGSYANGDLELDLAAQGLDARALHGELVRTRLAGPLRARLGGETQSLEIDLRDARYALQARASRSQERIELASLQLASGDARLAAQGSLSLAGERRFAAQGRLDNFDPARFFPTKGAPRSVLNARFETQGALRPALDLALQFELQGSRIGAQTLAGKGEVNLHGADLRRIDIDLAAAGNRLTAVGAFGKVGDTLRVNLAASKLEALGWPGIAGDASADIVVSGRLADPEFSGVVKASRLRVARLLDIGGLDLQAQLGAGPQGKLAGLLRCAACALPSQDVPPLALELTADGLRSRHHLAARIGLPQQRELRLSAEGGLQDAALKSADVSMLSWSGTLRELVVRKLARAGAKDYDALLELAAPAALRVDRQSLSFGPASLVGLIGSVQIDRLAVEQGRWQSAGRWQKFSPLRVLAEFPALNAQALGQVSPQSLMLGGEWDFAPQEISAGARPVGRVAVWRESGDVALGALPLGLGEARLQASLEAGRVVASLRLHGARLGDIRAELTAPRAPPGGEAALIDTQAAWQGSLQAQMPDLAWLGPLLGERWQLAGQLNGQMQLSGSAARPQWRGEWRGENLALRELEQGMRLERGQALIEVSPERLLLRHLHFASDFQPVPRALRLDANVDTARLTGTPGRFEASGELALGGASAARAARLTLRLERIGVMQRPDQWVLVSGEGQVQIGERVLDIDGKLRVDAGFWSLGEAGRPQLSDDVVIRQAAAKDGTAPGLAARQVRTALHLDLDAALGNSFHFRGAGVESRLAGQIRVRSDDAGLPRATGSIRTVGGRFDAYGQKLDIERGIINFQGAIDNPGLNLLALRKNLPVEAGVAVTGTAQRPLIRLVSTPEVPDAEKLSWLVLGRSPEQQSGGDSAILLAAAQAIFGGQDGGLLSKLQQRLGVDEFGLSTGQIGSPGRLPTSRVASTSGFSGSQTVNGQIVSVGKRLSANALLSYEQSLDTTESIVKLTVNLSRQFSVVGSAGSESALDFFWHYSFGR